MKEELAKLLQEMERKAEEERIPIMQPEGIAFLCSYIETHHVRSILEIGAAIGYSAIRMASLDREIKVTTIERDQKRYEEAVAYIAKAGLEKQIQILEMDAFDFHSEEQFDLIFIDAAKAQYIKFFQQFRHNLQEDGAIITDNLEFHGMVSGEVEIKHSRNLKRLVRKICGYIAFLQENEEFESEFLKIGDGIAISRRRKGQKEDLLLERKQ